MYPIYGYMDSYPQACHPDTDQAFYPQHVYPSWESPFNGTLRYFSPGDCNGAWKHAYPPAPFISYPHHHLPQHHFHGAYSPCPNVYPAYFISPLQYLVDQGRSHCCGCPNHLCQKRDDCGLKIEEENPGIMSKDNGSSGMTRWPAYPYPLVLFPPDYMKDNDHKTSKLKDNGSSDMIQWPTYPYPRFWFPPDHMKDNNHKASEPEEHGPLDRWIPLDTNSLKSFRENGEKKIQKQQNGAKELQLPLPIIWTPSYDQSQEAEKDVKDANASPRVAEDLPPKFKIIPVNLLENDNLNGKPGVEDVNPGSQICPTLLDKGSRHKSIPVKHMEESGPKKLDHPGKQGDYGSEKLSAPERQKEENREKKTSDDGTEKQTSPGRSSKLPPVCLRVDPLPRKKTGTGSPRSPSPPGNKEVKDNQESKESKAGGSGGLKESKKDASMDKEVIVVGAEDRSNCKSQKDGTNDMNRVVDVEDRSTCKKVGEGKNQNKLYVDSTKNHLALGIEVVAATGKSADMAKGVEDEKHGKLEDSEEVSLGHFENKTDDCKNTFEASDVKKMEENTGRRAKLSEIDAVLHIQAAYRGYNVRRCEPLKKLKQIARIRDRMSSIKQQIHSLEISSEGGQLDEKQRLFTGETIMNLLLQLDTIQGLHPSVREIRKSVARDLVSLQEKLDILSSKVAGGLVHIEAGDAPTVRDSKNALEDVCCNSTSDLKESSFPQEEPAQPHTDSLDYSAVHKQERAGELLLGDCVGQNSTPSNKCLIEIRDEQIPNSETGLIVRSEFENEEPCCSETEEYTKPPTAIEIGVDSRVINLSELPTREEQSYTIVEEAQELQQGVQDERVQASGKDDSPDEVDIYLKEDNKAEDNAEELLEMQAKQAKQPAATTQPFCATVPVMLQEEENVLREEEVVPVVEDLMNIQEHEPMPSSDGSESSQQYGVSVDGNKASIVQNGETRLGELPDEPLENSCAKADDAGSRILPCSESTIPDVDVKENGSESVTAEKNEFEEVSRYESVNSQVPAKECDVEHPNVEILDAPMPASSAGVDLTEDDNNHKMPALLVEENIPEDEENDTNSELPDIKGVSALRAGSTIGIGCSTEHSSPTRACVEFKVPETEETSVDDMEHERKLIEENEQLRELLEKLLEVGNKQVAMISCLSWRVKDLEKNVARRRKLRVKQHRPSKGFPCNNLVPKAALESAV